MAKMDMNRQVWEGWTPQLFVYELQPELDKIMYGQSWRKPFTTKAEMVAWIKDNQPYYKKSIPEVNAYFAKRYGLK